MTLNEYQQQAMTTCMDSCRNIPYMLFNLQGEVGELSSKIAKAIRKGILDFAPAKKEDGQTVKNYAFWDLKVATEKDKEEQRQIKAECGDVLWQLSGLCSVLGLSLEDVAQHNLDKLASRKQRGTANGDRRNRRCGSKTY